jgi:hypothetical protein
MINEHAKAVKATGTPLGVPIDVGTATAFSFDFMSADRMTAQFKEVVFLSPPRSLRRHGIRAYLLLTFHT